MKLSFRLICIGLLFSIIIFNSCTKKENPKITEPAKVSQVEETNKPPQSTINPETDRLEIIKDTDILPNLKGLRVVRSHFVEVDGWLFYYKTQHWYTGESFHGEAGIYKIKTDGTGCKKLVDLSKWRDPRKITKDYLMSHLDDFSITPIETLQVGQGYVWYSIMHDQKNSEFNDPPKMYNVPIGDGFPAEPGVAQLIRSNSSFDNDISDKDVIEPVASKIVRDHFESNDNYAYWYKEQYIYPRERVGEAGIYRLDKKNGNIDRVALTSEKDMSKYDRQYVIDNFKEFKIEPIQYMRVENDTYVIYKYYDGRVFKQNIGDTDRTQIPKWK